MFSISYDFSSEWYPEEPCPDLQVNSIIISAVAVKSTRNRTGVDELNTTALAEPIVITLQHKDATHVGPNCAFLNEQEVQMGNGRWLTEGCIVNENRSDSDTTVCECSHLTSFAILTSPAGPPVSQTNKCLKQLAITDVCFFTTGSKFCPVSGIQDWSLYLHTLSHHYYHTALCSEVTTKYYFAIKQ